MSFNTYHIIIALLFILFWVIILWIRKICWTNLKKMEVETEKLEKYTENLDGLLSMLNHFQEMGMVYRSADDLVRLCNLVVDYATKIAGTDMGSLMLVDKTTNKLNIVASKGLKKDVVDSTSMDIGEGIAGRVAQLGKAIYCENIETDVRFMRGSQVKYGSKSFISVPLNVKTSVIGVLNINHKNPGKILSKSDRKLITILADQAAVAIENIQLYENMKNMYLGTIQTLAKAIDARDPYTKGHTEKVTKYAVEIAKEMSLPYKLVRNIEMAAIIHDIGKIGIKDELLLKPAALSDGEYEVVKKHPHIGEQIISPIRFLTNVAPLVLYHHERYDGDGYLEGLKTDEIPIGARIINVADAFEAMTSDRPYRKGVSKEKAIEELKAESGSQFDPRVVRAFLRVLERNGTIEEGNNYSSGYDKENREETSGAP